MEPKSDSVIAIALTCWSKQPEWERLLEEKETGQQSLFSSVVGTNSLLERAMMNRRSLLDQYKVEVEDYHMVQMQHEFLFGEKT